MTRLTEDIVYDAIRRLFRYDSQLLDLVRQMVERDEHGDEDDLRRRTLALIDDMLARDRPQGSGG